MAKLKFAALAFSIFLLISISTIAQQTAPTQSATLSFDGMIALAMGQQSGVGICLLDAHHHTPRLVVKQVTSEGEKVMADIPAKLLKGNLSIALETASPTTLKSSVSKYHSASVRGDKQDLRWAIDFNELYPNAGALTIKEEKLWGKVSVNAGKWFTSKVSEYKWRFVSADPTKAAMLDFNRQIGDVVGQIPMDNGDVLTIAGSEFSLRLLADHCSYKLEFTNLPPADMANSDHFLHYYEIIEQDLPKYMPLISSKASFAPFPEYCKPVLLSVYP